MPYPSRTMGPLSPVEVTDIHEPMQLTDRYLGTDGIHICNVETYKELTYCNQESLGAVSCTTWIKTKHSVAETICYGTGLGYLVFLHPNPVYVSLCQIVNKIAQLTFQRNTFSKFARDNSDLALKLLALLGILGVRMLVLALQLGCVITWFRCCY